MERIRQIDAEIAALEEEKESLMMNVTSGGATHAQSLDRGSNE